MKKNNIIDGVRVFNPPTTRSAGFQPAKTKECGACPDISGFSTRPFK